MNEELIKSWKKGWDEGVKSVIEFLKDMKELDFEGEYKLWANADEYTKKNGEVVKRYG